MASGDDTFLVSPFARADLCAESPPVLGPCQDTTFAQADEVRPVFFVYVLKFRFATPPIFHDHICCEEAILQDLRIEFHFLARDWIDQRHDHFEEGIDKEGDVDDGCKAESLRVVVLENVKNPESGGKGGSFASISEVDEDGEVPARIIWDDRGNQDAVVLTPHLVPSNQCIAQASIQ